MTKYLLPFEAISILLLGALIGAALLSREAKLVDQLNNYLFIAAILFSLGVFGVMTRRNGIAVLMGVELILNAANLNFIAFSRFGGMNLDGHIFGLIVIVLAAAEAAVALAIVINIYNNLNTINIDEASMMKE